MLLLKIFLLFFLPYIRNGRVDSGVQVGSGVQEGSEFREAEEFE
jgi:hypothetical protein